MGGVEGVPAEVGDAHGGLRGGGGRTWLAAGWGTVEGARAGGNGELALNISDVKHPGEPDRSVPSWGSKSRPSGQVLTSRRSRSTQRCLTEPEGEERLLPKYASDWNKHNPEH